MAKFKITETSEIIKAFQETTFIVEADSVEEAIEKLEGRYNDDTDIEEGETKYDVRDTEHIRYTYKKLT